MFDFQIRRTGDAGLSAAAASEVARATAPTAPPRPDTAFVSATGENDGRLGARILLRSGRTPGAVNESVTRDSCTGQREHGVRSAAFRAGRATPLPSASRDGDVAGDDVPDPAKTDVRYAGKTAAVATGTGYHARAVR